MGLRENSFQIFESKGPIRKIFRNKDLRDPFASLRISAAGSRFAHARYAPQLSGIQTSENTLGQLRGASAFGGHSLETAPINLYYCSTACLSQRRLRKGSG